VIVEKPMDAYNPNSIVEYHSWLWEFKRAMPISKWPKTPEEEMYLRGCYADGLGGTEAAVCYVKEFSLL
jgi:hypothetical protein